MNLRLLLAGAAMSAFISISAVEPPARMLIVTPVELKAEAESLARLHRDYGAMTVEVAVDTDISPAADNRAIADYAASVYASGGGELRYLLLMGDGAAGEELPDISYGMVSPLDAKLPVYFRLPDIAVGRIPADTPAHAADYVAKAARYMERHSARHRHDVLIACDDGDDHEHLSRAERLAEEFESGNVHKAYLDLDRQVDGKAEVTRGRFVTALREGVDLMLYAGHGNSSSITAEELWNNRLAMTESFDNPCWAFFSSCGVNSFRDPAVTLAEWMIYNPRGGAMGIIAATESVYSSYNQELALSFVKHRAEAGPGAAIGDVWLATLRDCLASARGSMNHYFGRNIMSYALTGDPALPLYLPDSEISLDDEPGDLRALARFQLSGTVDWPEAAGGEVEVTVYAPARLRPTLGQKGDEAGIIVECRDTPLWRGKGRVDGGRFALPVTLPEGESGAVRFRLCAESDDRVHCAVAFVDGVPFTGEAPHDAAPDAVAPFIVMDVDDNLEFHATVTDAGSGVDLGASRLGTGMTLTVDGKLRRLTATSAGPGEVEITCLLDDLLPGEHKAILRVSDIAGNVAAGEMGFTVSGGSPVIELEPFSCAAREEAVFKWRHTFDRAPQVTLVVTGLLGETVHHFTGTEDDAVHTWRLAGVEPGIYTCRLLATDGRRHAASAIRHLVVLR